MHIVDNRTDPVSLIRRGDDGLAIKGRAVEYLEVHAPLECRGEVVGTIVIHTIGGGVVYALLVDSGMTRRAVYLDRANNRFVSVILDLPR